MENLKLSVISIQVLNVMNVLGTATAKDLKKEGIEKLNSSHLVALKNRELIEQLDEKKIVVCSECGAKSKDTQYRITELGKSYYKK